MAERSRRRSADFAAVAATVTAALWAALVGIACSSTPITGEDYYALGTANFELKKYEAANYWFEKARVAEKTRNSSDYFLGRIAYETGDYIKALQYFDALLASDPNNVTLLKAVAFTSLKSGDNAKAIATYDRVVELVPNGADVNYNYALLLYTAGRRDSVINLLIPYIENNKQDNNALLLLARSEASQRSAAAVGHFTDYLERNDDPSIRRELAETCEAQKLYGKAIEQYQAIIAAGKEAAAGTIAGDIHFAQARAQFFAGAEGASASLAAAIQKGFRDAEALEALAADERAALPEEDRQLILKTLSPESGPASDSVIAAPAVE